MKPDWKDAPKWSQWLANSRFGVWHWYENEPVLRKDEWFPTGGIMQDAGIDAEIGDDISWRTTLERRPMTNPSVMAELDELIEYFNARADAEYHTDSASPAPNEAMKLGIAATVLRARVEALMVARKPFCVPIRDIVPNSYVPRFDINAGHYRALSDALRRIGDV